MNEPLSARKGRAREQGPGEGQGRFCTSAHAGTAPLLLPDTGRGTAGGNGDTEGAAGPGTAAARGRNGREGGSDEGARRER